jgi:hypothetical protein
VTLKKAENRDSHTGVTTLLLRWLSTSLHRHLKTDLQKNNDDINDEGNLNILWKWQNWQYQQYFVLNKNE